jgi:hypothetical protein
MIRSAHLRGLRAAFFPVVLGLLVSCDDGPVQPPDTGDVVSVIVQETPSPFVRAVTVTLARAASARVTWGSPSATILTQTADSASTTHRFLIPRLRAARLYTVEVTIPGDAAPPFLVDFTTAPLSPALSSVTLADSGLASRPLALVEVAGASGFGGLLVVEGGEIVGHLPLEGSLFGSTRRANGEIVLLDGTLGLTSFTIDGTAVDRLEQSDATKPYGRIHHDVLATPTNTILFIANDTATITDTLVTGEAIWEWDPATGEVEKKFSAFDHLDWKTFRGPRSTVGNWLHGNGINFGPRGNILMSLRNADYVISIAPDFGSVEWSLGGPAGTLGIAPEDRFYGQHFISEPVEGRVLVFDNGVERAPPYTRVIEYEVDTGADTVTKAWEYRHDPDIYAALVGSARRLPNGNTLALFGMLTGHNGSSGPITAVEVTNLGAVLWRLTFGGSITRVYRVNSVTSLIGETTGAFIDP